MPKQINTISELNEYVEGVMDRANDHGDNVNEVILTLIGVITWKALRNDILVRVYKENTANVLWMTIGQKRFAFTYNHEEECIEMKDRTLKGNTVEKFDNSTTAAEIKSIFERL